MIDLKRIAGSVVTRVIVALILAVLFAVFGTGKAHADTWCGITDLNTAAIAAGLFNTYPTSAQALAACNSMPNEVLGFGGGAGWWAVSTGKTCAVVGTGPGSVNVTYTDSYSFNVSNCGNHYATSPAGRGTNGWGWTSSENVCASKPDYTFTPSGNQYAPPMGAVGCTNGCATAYFDNGDGTYTGKPSVMSASCDTIPDCSALGLSSSGYTFNAYAGTCEPPMVECESNEVEGPGGICTDACPAGMHTDETGACKPDGDNCAVGEIKAPSGECLPGEGQCAAGEAKKKDGTCGKDSDGDGEADDDDEDPENDSDKEQFSGGDSCNSPPSCSGSPIMCGQARIQWRIDCNTRKDITITGGSCASVPICTGKNCNAMEYAQLLMQWRTSCKTAGEASGESGQPEWTKVGGMSQDPGAGSSEDDLKVLTEKELSTDDLDNSGIGGAAGGSCPALIEGGSGLAHFSGFAAELAAPSAQWCGWIGKVHAIVILFAGMGCAVIFASMGRA